MSRFDLKLNAFIGENGTLLIREEDEITRKIAMLIEGECEMQSRTGAARKFGFSRQRYYQIRDAYLQGGAAMLESKTRGPKTKYRSTIEIVRQVIRYRFLDPQATAQVIAQRLNQTGWVISIRSVERIIQEFGLQKKTP